MGTDYNAYILVLAYDNMCHLDSLKMFKKPLPANGDMALIWEKITKVVDDLHIRNHVPACRDAWSPDIVKELHPNINLMVDFLKINYLYLFSGLRTDLCMAF